MLKTLLESITIVVALPPAMILEGIIEWIPVFESLCWAKFIPTLKAVGKVIGIDVASKSMNKINIDNSEALFILGTRAKKAIAVINIIT